MNFKRKLAYWTVPEGFQKIILSVSEQLRNSQKSDFSELIKNNSKFKDIHKGERCFIVCNGPSINKQDLKLLKNDIVFSVSNGYHHTDYHIYKPKYHCLPRLLYTELFTEADASEWFKEMHENIGTAQLFLDVMEDPLVRKYDLFHGRKINYYYSCLPFEEKHKEIIDISRKIQAISTVPVLAMTLAMYMGFKKIYLIGIDNDWWKIGEYKYFFEPTVLKGKDFSTYPDGKNREPLYCQFFGFGSLLRDYWILHNIARKNNISIYNATKGGALEEFERVKFEGLFNPDN